MISICKCYKIILINLFFASLIFSNEPIIINVLEQDMNHVVLEYIIQEFEMNEISIENEIFHKIDLHEEFFSVTEQVANIFSPEDIPDSLRNIPPTKPGSKNIDV